MMRIGLDEEERAVERTRRREATQLGAPQAHLGMYRVRQETHTLSISNLSARVGRRRTLQLGGDEQHVQRRSARAHSLQARESVSCVKCVPVRPTAPRRSRRAR